MILGNNCWIDIEKADKNHVVVVPLGSLEQHGHHLPLLTDTYLVTAVADRVEIELVIKYICCLHFGLALQIIILTILVLLVYQVLYTQI